MIDPSKLQYFTMAAWMRGYASGLDADVHPALVHKLNKAADMMDSVWQTYVEETEDMKQGGTD